MAYEAMTPDEWVAQWLYALPGFGPAAAHMAFPGSVGRLGWEDRPDTFYMVGNTLMIQDLAKNAPNPANQVGYLLRKYVLAEPLRFLAVTLVLAWKALWVRKYFSLVAVPFLRHHDVAGGPAAGRDAARLRAAARCSSWRCMPPPPSARRATA